MKLSLLSLSTLLFLLTACSDFSEKKFIEMANPANQNSSLPRLFTDPSGNVTLSWVEENDGMATLYHSLLQNGIWSEPKMVRSDSSWFINWADYPSVITQNGSPMAAHWLQKTEGDWYAYHVNMVAYDQQKRSAPFQPYADSSATEHGFVSMYPMDESRYMAAWLDGRKTHDRAEDEYNDLNKAMTLRAALIHRSGKVQHSFEIDPTVCDCCNTALTRTDQGFIVAYRNRTEDEIRDIYTATYKDGEWSAPVAVHNDGWKIAACPVNGPAIDAEEHYVALAWFTGANDQAAVKMAISKDHGQTFGPPIVLDEGKPSGRVDLKISEKEIWVSWLTQHEGKSMLRMKNYSMEGNELDTVDLFPVSNKRSAGFPHIALAQDQLIVAHTLIDDDGIKRVKTHTLSLN